MKRRLNLAEFGARRKSKPACRTGRHKWRVIFYSLTIIIIIIGYSIVFQKIYAGSIWPRVYCNDLNLSGLKPAEARVLLTMVVDKLELEGFSFYARTDLGEKRVKVEPKLIGLADPDLSREIVKFNIDKTLEKAFQIGREGNFFENFLKTFAGFAKDKTIDLELDLDAEELAHILWENFKDIEKPIQDARAALSEGKLMLIEGKSGFNLDYQEAVSRMAMSLRIFKNVEIEIPVLSDNSQITAGEAQEAFNQVKDIFDRDSYVLGYKEKKWPLEARELSEWFEFKKEENGVYPVKSAEGGAAEPQFNRVNLALNEAKIIQYLADIAAKINIEPIDAKFEMENNRVVGFQASRDGLVLNQTKSAGIISRSILDKIKEIDLAVEEIRPAKPIEDINDLGIKELIGRGVSNFAGSPKNRRYNIKIGSQKLHGILIAPDEEFSLVKAIGPVNKETGFLPELVIKGDRTIPEYGGGLCQIGTTTFRVALNAGLPITERTPHSYRVVYYEPAGTDATIYNPSPDLKFINDTNHYILFQTEINGDELIFEFYGTSDGRKIETTRPTIFNITSPGPARFIETDELSPGEKKRIEIAHPGADTEFKNIITFPNGTAREEVWKSHYKAWPEVWLVGKEEEQPL